jgi:hypothetical protein
MENDNTINAVVKLLISRLERLSVDSRWAHRASGLRGSLWRWVEYLEKQESYAEKNIAPLETLMIQGFEILEAAAREITAPEK